MTIPGASMTKDIGTLVGELGTAKKEYKEAQSGQSVAEARSTRAINKLNAAQCAITEWYETQKKDAPRTTDWKR